MADPEQTYLTSKEFLAAVEGARSGLSLKGYTADDDTLGTVAMSVLVMWVQAGGLEEAAILEMTAMMVSVARRMSLHLDAEPKH